MYRQLMRQQHGASWSNTEQQEARYNDHVKALLVLLFQHEKATTTTPSPIRRAPHAASVHGGFPGPGAPQGGLDLSISALCLNAIKDKFMLFSWKQHPFAIEKLKDEGNVCCRLCGSKRRMR